MQQLDYWFAKYPNGFFKYLSPLYKMGDDGKPVKDESGASIIEERGGYKKGKSWTEELYFSESEFLTAFAHVGIRHTSRKALTEADKEGKTFTRPDGSEALYCSFFDRKTGMTWYLRNHAVTDAALDSLIELITANQDSADTEINNHGFCKPTIMVSVNQQSQFLETNNLGINKRILQETKKEITEEINTITSATPPGERDPKTLPIPFDETPKPKPKRIPTAPNGFEEFWQAYPKKVAKPEAQKAWLKLKLDADAQADIQKAIAERSQGDPQWTTPQYIPNPATYLNQRRWEDEWRPQPGQVVNIQPTRMSAVEQRAQNDFETLRRYL